MHETWIIDDRGTVWHAADPALRRELGTRLAACDLLNFLVRQMGFVAIVQHPVRTEIICDPDIVSPVALTEYFYWVADRAFQPTTLVNAATPHVACLFIRPLALHNQLSAIIAARTPAAACAEFSSRPDVASFEDRWSAALEIRATLIEAPLKLNILQDLFRGHVLQVQHRPDGDYTLSIATPAGDARQLVVSMTTPPSQTADTFLIAVNRN